jgi:hypothetical protein
LRSRRADPGLQAGEETPLPTFSVSRGIPTQINANMFDIKDGEVGV